MVFLTLTGVGEVTGIPRSTLQKWLLKGEIHPRFERDNMGYYGLREINQIVRRYRNRNRTKITHFKGVKTIYEALRQGGLGTTQDDLQ